MWKKQIDFGYMGESNKLVMTKEQEKELIKARFNHYYNNCDDWGMGDIEFQLRADFSSPKTMSRDECYTYISELTD